MKRPGMMLLRVNVVFFLIVKGALVVSICLDPVIRREATEYFGFNPIYLGAVGIITGSALMAWISRWEAQKKEEGRWSA